MRRALLKLSVIAAFAAAAPAAAPAATTIGAGDASTWSLTGDCYPGDREAVLAHLPEIRRAAGGLRAPSGVVTRWSISTFNGAYAVGIALRIYDDLGAAGFRFVRESAHGVVSDPDSQGENAFATRLPITSGQAIGLRLIGDGANPCFNNDNEAACDTSGFIPPLLAGASGPGFASDACLPLRAVVEPDADGDGFGDETQDGCPTLATSQVPCVPLDPCQSFTKKQKKSKKKCVCRRDKQGKARKKCLKRVKSKSRKN
jgi:hypothetical protein